MGIRHICFVLALGLGLDAPALAAEGPSPARSRLGQLLRRDPPPGVVPPQPKPLAPGDPTVRRAQSEGLPLASPLSPPSAPMPALTSNPASLGGGQPLSLQAALYGALTSNPDLVTLRQGNALANAPSPEAVEVARRFPTTLNPTLWLDYRPIVLIPNNQGGARPGSRGGERDYYRSGQQFLYLSLRQPLELGYQTRHRFDIARAALDQQRWTVTQAELTALVQTYRVFQTAAYRRERLRVAGELADSNDRLLASLQRRLEANQAAAADVILARVESRSARQQVKAVRQDYLTALADLSNQVGVPEAAGATEPLGEFTLPATIPPIDEQAMIRAALENRPDIHAARAQLAGAEAAVRLARADRIPSPVVGPEYQVNEGGTQFVGLVYITPIPLLNGGKPLVLQREAENRRAVVALRQAQNRAIAQVRNAVSRWNGATDLMSETTGLSGEMGAEMSRLERLFEEGQADLTRLMQARQRIIQLENLRLDAVWAATQAQADLLLALGVPNLINAMLAKAETEAIGPRPDQGAAAPGAIAPPGSPALESGAESQPLTSPGRP